MNIATYESKSVGAPGDADSYSASPSFYGHHHGTLATNSETRQVCQCAALHTGIQRIGGKRQTRLSGPSRPSRQERRVWPSQATIARRTALSIRCVRRSIARLTEIGLISCEVVTGTSNHYTFTDPEVGAEYASRGGQRVRSFPAWGRTR